MLLTYNGANGLFVLYTDNPAQAVVAGLTKSTTAKGRPGMAEVVYFTDCAPAVVPFAQEHGDDLARLALADMLHEYDRSFAKDGLVIPGIVPPGLELMPFQHLGVDYGRTRRHVLFGDEPGLGKTVQAIALANYDCAERVLVICPASLRLNWQREIRRWSTLKKLSTYPVLKSGDGVNPHANYVIISYDLARLPHVANVLKKIKWDHVVLDEAHYLKTPDAQRTQAIFGHNDLHRDHHAGIADGAGRTVALTGTPLPNRPRECYTLTRALCWDAIDWQSYDHFIGRYNPSFKWPSGRIEERTGRLPELQARLRCNFMVRRSKADVLKDLPAKRYELTYVEPDGAIRKVLAKEKMLDFSIDDLEDPNFEILGAIATVRREMGEAKAPRVIEHVDMLLDGGVDKILLFAHHRNVMDLLAAGLGKHGLVRIDGSVSAVARSKIVDQFQQDPKTRVFLGQLKAAGEGLTLTAASHVVFAEASWSSGENEQGVDRAHRIGQLSSVLAQFVVAPGSLDEKILSRAIEKSHHIHAALDKRF